MAATSYQCSPTSLTEELNTTRQGMKEIKSSEDSYKEMKQDKLCTRTVKHTATVMGVRETQLEQFK